MKNFFLPSEPLIIIGLFGVLLLLVFALFTLGMFFYWTQRKKKPAKKPEVLDDEAFSKMILLMNEFGGGFSIVSAGVIKGLLTSNKGHPLPVEFDPITGHQYKKFNCEPIYRMLVEKNGKYDYLILEEQSGYIYFVAKESPVFTFTPKNDQPPVLKKHYEEWLAFYKKEHPDEYGKNYA